MSLLKNIFGRKDMPVKSYEDFWNWFQTREKSFHKVIKERGNIEREFFNKLSHKLDSIKKGFYYLTGMSDEHTAELVFTADGTVKNIAFVEDLVQAAPKIDGWLFTALKPALDIINISIEMGDYKFNSGNLHFYPHEHPDFPDEIEITIVHDDYDEKDKTNIINGTYIFLDNYLGELNFVTTIDTLHVAKREDLQKELMPVEKLKDYLNWRQKEFIEKYESVRYDTDKDNYSIMEAKLENGNTLIAVINTDLLAWDGKASHPWVINVEIKYDGRNNNGMPDDKTYKLLDEIEQGILSELVDSDGYLNIGRQTADNSRVIYFACKDFRKPSRVLHRIEQSCSGRLDFSYEIYKDKYWQTFNRFRK